MIGKKIINFSKIDSTSKYIKDNLFQLELGTIVMADYQSNGYGRKNRTWIDKKKENLTFSFLIKQRVTDKTNLISQLIGVAIINSLKDLNIEATIKWPNDILITNKKVAGILVETKILKDEIYLIIGIGLNINQMQFEQEISSKATSLKVATGKSYIIEEVLDIIILHINKLLLAFNNQDYSFLQICREKNALLNKLVTLETSEQAKVIDIDNDGNLVVLINNKERKYFGSEITLANSYNVLGE